MCPEGLCSWSQLVTKSFRNKIIDTGPASCAGVQDVEGDQTLSVSWPTHKFCLRRTSVQSLSLALSFLGREIMCFEN